VAAMGPEYMTEALGETAGRSGEPVGIDPADVERVLEMARDVIALGPGLGQAPATQHFITALVDRASMPLVIDADGLNAFSWNPDRLAGREGRDVIITPHPGEMARSEEHTSELQSRSDLVCRLLLEKKKQSFPVQSRYPGSSWATLIE